jgi:general secretion pathway protein C
VILLREGDGPIRRPSPAVLRRGLEIGLVALLAVQAARLVWAAVTPLGPLGQPAAASLTPPPADVSVLARFDPFHRDTVSPALGAPVAETTALRLFGVRAGAGGGSAIIGGADGKQQAYRVGEAVASGVTLQSVAADHVVLSVNGRLTSLAFLKPAVGTAPPPAPTLYTPQPAQGTADAGARLAELAGQLPLQPRMQDGRVTGLQVRPGGDGGPILAGAGLQPGDVLVSVNGKPIAGAESVGAELANSNQAVVEYERGAERRTATLRMARP